jgi:hypothetical protein
MRAIQDAHHGRSMLVDETRLPLGASLDRAGHLAGDTSAAPLAAGSWSAPEPALPGPSFRRLYFGAVGQLVGNSGCSAAW